MRRIKVRPKFDRLPVLGATVASLLVAIVWFAARYSAAPTQLSQHVHVDLPTYSSIEELSAVSDLVVFGNVEGVLVREIGYKDPEGQIGYGNGIPIVFYAVEVTETLKGESENTTITVMEIDVEAVDIGEDSTPLRRGQEVLLFLMEKTAEDRAGLSYNHFYAAASMDNGIFDKAGNNIYTPRLSYLFPQNQYRLNEIREKLPTGEVPNNST